MNIDRMSRSELEGRFGKKLQEILEKIPWIEHWEEPYRSPVEVEKDWIILCSFSVKSGDQVNLILLCHRDPRPARVPKAQEIDKNFIERLQRDLPHVAIERFYNRKNGQSIYHVLVFAAPYISERMAEVLNDKGWSWFDLAGNCSLSIHDWLSIEKEGKKPVHSRNRPKVSLSSPEAVKVVMALLNPENIDRPWKQREVIYHLEVLRPYVSSVSLGLVNKIVRYLKEEAYAKNEGSSGFILTDPEGLLREFQRDYQYGNDIQQGYFTLLKGSQIRERLAKITAEKPHKLLYGFFSAAELIHPHVRQPKIWLYMDYSVEPIFCEALEAKPVDSGENIVVYFPKFDHVFYSPYAKPGHIPATNPIQTYLDLTYAGGRGPEAAEAILENYLKPVWKGAGEQ